MLISRCSAVRADDHKRRRDMHPFYHGQRMVPDRTNIAVLAEVAESERAVVG